MLATRPLCPAPKIMTCAIVVLRCSPPLRRRQPEDDCSYNRADTMEADFFHRCDPGNRRRAPARTDSPGRGVPMARTGVLPRARLRRAVVGMVERHSKLGDPDRLRLGFEALRGDWDFESEDLPCRARDPPILVARRDARRGVPVQRAAGWSALGGVGHRGGRALRAD